MACAVADIKIVISTKTKDLTRGPFYYSVLNNYVIVVIV